MGKQVHCHPYRQGMVVQNRVQLATPFLVGGVIAGPRKQIAEAEEAAHQRPATRSQKAEPLTRPHTSNDGFGFVLENHGFRGDSAHGSPGITRRSLGLARPSKLLDCRWRMPAASKAAHVPTLSPCTTCGPACELFGIATTSLRHTITLFAAGHGAAPRVRQGYGCGATMTSREVVDKITKAMQSSAPITTARVEMPPARTGTPDG
jgi:hypothetical protein